MPGGPSSKRDWSGHPVVVIIGVVAGLAAVVALVLQVTAGDDDGDDDTVASGVAVTSSPSPPLPTGAPPPTSVGNTPTTTEAPPDPGLTTTLAPTPTTVAPAGVDLSLALQTNTCSIVPGGGLNGGDVMTLLFRVSDVGTEDYSGTVRATARTDTGLEGQSTGGLSDGPGSNFVQVEFAGQDYGRTHNVTVNIEPTDGVDVNPSDNEASIAVALPAQRPSGTFDPCQ